MNYASEALEKQIECLANLQRYYNTPRLRPGVSDAERGQWVTDMHALRRAQPFFWNSRTVELVNTLAEDFNLDEVECTRSMVYIDVAFHWFSERSPLELELRSSFSGATHMAPVRALVWYWFHAHNEPYLGGTAYCPVYLTDSGSWCPDLAPAVWFSVNAGTKMSQQIPLEQIQFQGISDDRTILETQKLKQFVVAASTFMRQRLLRVEQTPVERHVRKRLERAGLRGLAPTTVNIVQLRRAEIEATTHNSDAHTVEWQWSWTVKGHVRQQWYSTLNEHLPVYIHPHLKGPDDKPLKPRTTPIFSVTR